MPDRVVIDMVAVGLVVNGPQARVMVDEYGDRIAAAARGLAAKATGAGAASITAQSNTYQGHPASDVSWDEAHHYMLFDEVGTYKMAAHPALGPALDQYAQ